MGSRKESRRDRAIQLLRGGDLERAVAAWEDLRREDPQDVDAMVGLLHALADPERREPVKAPVRAAIVAREIDERTRGRPKWARERKYTLLWLARATDAGHPALVGVPRSQLLEWIDEARALAGDYADTGDLGIARLAIRIRRAGDAAERADAREILEDLLTRLGRRMTAGQVGVAVVEFRADAEDLGVRLPAIERAPERLPIEADIDDLAREAHRASLEAIEPYRWRNGAQVLDDRVTGAPWLARVFACSHRPETAWLHMMAAIRAAEWRLPEHEPAIRWLVLTDHGAPSPFLADLALASARLLPRGDGTWHAVPLDPATADPVFAAAVLSARLHLRPDDAATHADVLRLWDRARSGVVTTSYAEGSVFFGPGLALRFAGAPLTRPLAAEVAAIVDREIDGTRAEGCEEQALWVLFWALDAARYT